jgi:transposase-like protein
MFHDEDAARAHLERLRWANGVYCPHCGATDKVRRMEGKSHRPGLHQCNACREPFTVTVGTVMERSHIALTKWVMGFHLMAASKKGMSAAQLSRMLGITYKSAWFMAHRIREAMTPINAAPIGGEGKIVEADEMYHGTVEIPQPLSRGRVRRPTKSGRSGVANKRTVIALVERGGEVRAEAMTGKPVTAKNVGEVLRKYADAASRLQTDESRIYPPIAGHFASHETVHHGAGEYARGKGADLVTTNSVEGFFGVFKRGFTGIYQHCGEQHLQRYLNEYTFRYNHRIRLGYNDDTRAALIVQGASGKRLTYRGTCAA